MGLGLRERVKRAIFSSRPGLSSHPSSSRLAERLEQAKEYTIAGPSQNKLQHRHRHRHQHQDQHQHQQQQQQQHHNQDQMHPPTSPTTKKSFRASIIKTLSPRTSNRKSKIEEPWPKIELYKPHEIPRPKYRGPVDKRHLAVLEAYSIVQATEGYRQRSIDSSVCPLATNLPSRRDSVTSISETAIVRRPGDVEDGVGAGEGAGEVEGDVEVEVEVEAQVDDDINIRNTNRDSLQDEEDSNTTSTASSDEGANVSSSTLLTSHTEDEQLQHLQKQQRPSVTRLKRTTAFTAADLHHALNSL